MAKYAIHKLIFVAVRMVIGGLLTVIILTSAFLSLPLILSYRLLVVFISKCVGLGRMLTPMDMLMWEEFSRDKVPQNSLVIVCELENGVCVEAVKKLFEELINGQCDELGMRVRNFLGFKVLERIREFEAADYIGEQEGVWSVSGIHEEMVNRKFLTSLWEVVLFNNGSVIGMRVHHSVADGLSLLKLFVERIGGKTLVKSERRSDNKIGLNVIQRWVKVFCGIGLDGVMYWWEAVFRGKSFLFAGDNGWRKKTVVRVGDMIELGRIKGVSLENGVCGSSVITAGILGGFEKFAQREIGSSVCGMRCGYVLPVCHSGVMCNHWRTTYTTIINEASAPPSQKSLKRFDEIIKEMKTGSLSVFLKYSIIFSAWFVSPLAKVFLKNRVCGVGITNIAGDDEGFNVLGKNCNGFTLSSAGLSGVGLMFCVLSYKRRFRVCCVADERVLNGEMCQVLSGYINKEFEEILMLDEGIGVKDV